MIGGPVPCRYTIPELQDQLPKAPGGQEPLAEGLIWLLMTVRALPVPPTVCFACFCFTCNGRAERALPIQC